ncbi:hypothetical protein HZC09_04540 [Candidatus Micrarchaeota archaeon]|nr:hypothetical protein [Candidatus Micrarchaeota archaeon]
MFIYEFQEFLLMKDKTFYYLLGLFAGDGWFQSRGISIGTKYKQRANEIATLMKVVLGRTPKIKRRKYADGHIMYLISVYSVAVERLFRRLLGNPIVNKSKTFLVPHFTEKESARSFVKGLFDAEAYEYVWRSRPRIGFAVFNKKAAEFVRELLASDSIRCSLSCCSDGAFRIDITGKNHVDRFHLLYDWLGRESPSSK